MFHLSESEEEDTEEIDDEEFQKALQMHRKARARTRISTEAEENNLEIATFLNRIISKKNEEMKMVSSGGDTELTSVWQNSANSEMDDRKEESGNDLSTEADIVHNCNYPVDQLVERDGRIEEEHSQMANGHRAGNNNGDGDTVGKRTSGTVQPRGGDKSSTSDAQQSDRKQNRRYEISEGDGIIASGKLSITAKNDMNATEMRCEAANKRNRHKGGKRKEDGNYDGRRMTNHQNAGRIAGGTSEKRRSDDARASTRSGEVGNRKESGRTKKRKDGPSQGVGNAVGGNLGKKGNLKNYRSTAGKRSKKSGSDDASSRKTSGEAMNEEASGRTKLQNGGYSKRGEDNYDKKIAEDSTVKQPYKKKKRKKGKKSDKSRSNTRTNNPS